jgi:hypothetical protein
MLRVTFLICIAMLACACSRIDYAAHEDGDRASVFGDTLVALRGAPADHLDVVEMRKRHG